MSQVLFAQRSALQYRRVLAELIGFTFVPQSHGNVAGWFCNVNRFLYRVEWTHGRHRHRDHSHPCCAALQVEVHGLKVSYHVPRLGFFV